MVLGRVHSIESMGLVDGPGIRAVVFLQGCSLRCKYCHNPDSWSMEGGEEMTAEALVQKLLRFRPYFERSGGGVTFSGGEPLLQPEFLLECLRRLKEEGVHTCLDTAGAGRGDYAELLRCTDLVLFDVKETAPDRYRELTGQGREESERFLAALRESGTPVWARHVLVPGRTDSPEAMEALKAYIREKVPNVQKAELLPYHLLGVNKYAAMGIPYALEGVPAMSKELTEQFQKTYFDELTGGN